MEQRIRELIDISKQALDLTRSENNTGVSGALEDAIRDLEDNPEAIVQLYSVSQAGKSTLFSMLTLGEQFVPVGLGKATTAVVIELVSATGSESAEVMWLSPADLLSLVLEPLEPFLDGDERKHVPSGLASGNSASEEPETEDRPELDVHAFQVGSLGDNRIVRTFLRALHRAKKFRNAETADVGSNNDLDVAEVILRNYRYYLGEYREGFQPVPLRALHKWTRQPYDWGSGRKVRQFGFDELRCFFVQRVRLFARTHPMIEGLRIVDTPGFGVSRLHDRICRKIQEQADAIVLLLGSNGSEINIPQLEEVQQLAAGLRDNLVVIWNPRSGTRTQASRLLPNDLRRLHQGAGVRVAADRAIVANLRLALRCLQWQKLSSERNRLSDITIASLSEAAAYSLDDDYVRGRTDRERAKILIERELSNSFNEFVGGVVLRESSNSGTAAAGLERSGWVDKIPGLFQEIRDSRTNRRARLCAERAIDAILFYLAKYPPPREAQNTKNNIRALHWLVKEFGKNAEEASGSVQESIQQNSELLLDELLDYIVDEDSLRNLRAGVGQVINTEVKPSVVHTKLRAKAKDYLEARCAVWCNDFRDFKSTQSKVVVRMNYEEATQKLQDWIEAEPAKKGATIHLDIPRASTPAVDFSAFRTETENAFGSVIDLVLKPGSFSRFMIALGELGRDVLDASKKGWNNLVAFVTNKPRKVTTPKLGFDRKKALEQAEKDFSTIFARQNLKYLFVVDSGAYRSLSVEDMLTGLAKAVGQGARSIGEAFEKGLEIVKEEREELSSSPTGPFLFALRAIEAAPKETFRVWKKAALETLVDLEENLVTQGKGLPSPLQHQTLIDVQTMVERLGQSMSGDLGILNCVTEARISINVRWVEDPELDDGRTQELREGVA
jgi:hypothetical protein